MVSVWSFVSPLALAVPRVRRFRLPFPFGVGLALVTRWFRMFRCPAPRVGVGYGRLRPPLRWFRLSFYFWTVWRWVWSPRAALVLVVRAVVSFYYTFVRRLVLVSPGENRKFALYTIRV